MPAMYDYRCVRCQYVTESPTRESLIWSCPMCVDDPTLEYSESHQPMKRYYSQAPAIPKMWHGDKLNLATGTYPTDYRKWQSQLSDAGKQAEDRTGNSHKFVEVDMSDTRSLNVTGEGMEATHRRHRELGWTEAKSSVHQLPGSPNTNGPS